MKKNISITLEPSIIEDVETMSNPEHHDRPSFSDMVAHLIKTNPKYMEFKTKQNRKQKPSGK